MADFSTVPVGLKTGTQLPLDAKSRSESELVLKSLGVDDQLAFTYEEGLVVRCMQEGTSYIWRSVVVPEPTPGLLYSNFTYPPGITAGGISYGGRSFNFFKLDYVTKEQLDKKVDKVTGERLINAAEIIKLDSLENVELVNPDWNVSSATQMSQMFNSTPFNQNLGAWNVSNVVNMDLFAPNNGGGGTSPFSSANIDAIYNGWSSRAVKPNVPLSFGTRPYTSASSAGRAILTGGPNNWVIVDGGVV
jgi:hypothetical protein